MPDLSIIVPVLNEAGNLTDFLASLAPLRERGAEIVIVDGGSDDGSADLARVNADQVVEAPRGRAAQMNAGATAARANTLVFLHADTQLPPGSLEAIRTARTHGARWGYFGLNIRGKHPMFAVIARLATLRSHLTGIATGDQALFVERTLFDSAGGFPDIALMEDITLSAKLRRMSRPARLKLRASTCARRWEQAGILRTILLMWRLRLLYRLGVSPDYLARAYRDTRERDR